MQQARRAVAASARGPTAGESGPRAFQRLLLFHWDAGIGLGRRRLPLLLAGVVANGWPPATHVLPRPWRGRASVWSHKRLLPRSWTWCGARETANAGEERLAVERGGEGVKQSGVGGGMIFFGDVITRSAVTRSAACPAGCGACPPAAWSAQATLQQHVACWQGPSLHCRVGDEIVRKLLLGAAEACPSSDYKSRHVLPVARARAPGSSGWRGPMPGKAPLLLSRPNPGVPLLLSPMHRSAHVASSPSTRMGTASSMPRPFQGGLLW